MFIVGDIITGIPGDHTYFKTNDHMYRGEVIARNGRRIIVRIIDHEIAEWNGLEYEVSSEHFQFACIDQTEFDPASDKEFMALLMA